jgi:SAM-dependent methyltransferase
MLNPVFPLDHDRQYGRAYALPAEFAPRVLASNAEIATGDEHRLHSVFGQELWRKIRSLPLRDVRWEDSDVLDLCCGTGFLSYHLLGQVTPRSLTLVDISDAEVLSARALITRRARGPVRYRVEDVTRIDPVDGTYDVVIGNSFLHHFWDIPAALDRIAGIVRPGGWFASLHEPTVAAIALETGSREHVTNLVRSGSGYVDAMRPRHLDRSKGITDVWMFEPGDLERLLEEAGFGTIASARWGLTRPFVAARRSIHFVEDDPARGNATARTLRRTTAADAVLRHVVPGRLFGSIAVAGRRIPPAGHAAR